MNQSLYVPAILAAVSALGADWMQFRGPGCSVLLAQPRVAQETPTPKHVDLSAGSGADFGRSISMELRSIHVAFKDPSNTQLLRGQVEEALPLGALARLGTTRFRQGGFIHTLLPCPDGKTLISNTRAGDRSVCLWELSTGMLLRQFPGIYYPVSIALSPNGKTLAVVREEHFRVGEGMPSKEVLLLELSSGKELGRFEAPGQVSALAFAPDGKTLAEAGDRHLVLWDLATKKEVKRFPTYIVSLLAFTANGKNLVSADPLNAPLQIWDVASGVEVQMEAGPRRVRSFTLSKDGATLAAAETNGMITVFNLAQRKAVRALRPRHEIVWTVALSPDGKTLAVGGTGDPGDGTISLWELATGRQLRSLKGHPWGTERLSFSMDGRTLVSGSGDSTIRLWDVATGAEVRPAGESQWPVTCLALSRDGQTLAVPLGGAACGGIRLCSPSTGKELGTLTEEPGDHLWCLAFSPDCHTLASATWRQTTGGYLHEIRLWDIRSRKIIGRMSQHKHQIEALVFSEDGKRLASAARDSTVRLWATESGQELRQFKGGRLMQSVAFSMDGRTIIAAEHVSGGERIWAWDADSGKEKSDLMAALNQWPKFNGDVTASAPDYIWFTHTGFSPDGKLLAVNRRLETIVQIFDAGSGKQRFLLRGHDKPVICFAFSPDSRTIATAAWDYTIRLWDAATGRELHKLTGPRGKVDTLAFLPDGKTLLSGGDDTTILTWDVANITRRKPSSDKRSLPVGTGLTTEAVKSGPQIGEMVPGSFYPLNVTGTHAAKKACLYCDHGASPVAVVFARAVTPQVAVLLKKLDEATVKYSGASMGSYAVFLSDREGLEDELKEMARQQKLQKLVLSIDSAVGPKSYNLSKDAQVTVLLYNELKVRANHAFKTSELSDSDISRVVADVAKIVPSK